MKICNLRLDEKEFEKIRKEVLLTWPTGKEVDLDESIDYHKKMKPQKILSFRLYEAKKKGITLVQPRAGVATLNEHIELLQFLEKSGADILPTTIDTYTRQNRYQDSEKGLKESINAKKSLLNGFPAVNYGVSNCRKIIESVSVPVQVRHGSPDARLLAEITLAAGFTGFEGGGITYNIPYAKNVSLEHSIRNWQYVDRLVGLYQENGVTINRESFGPLTGTLVPPSICITVSIIEALLAAEQGVRSFTVGYAQCGNIIQDIAAVKSLKENVEQYLHEFGYEKMEVTTCFHQWMGAFPLDEAQAFGVICLGAATAILSEANKIITKSPHEAYGVPTKEANANGIKATKQIIRILKNQKLTRTAEFEDECEIIDAEVACIMDSVLRLGKGDVAVGTINAFKAGVLDVPYAPSVFNKGKVKVMKDVEGAVRFLDVGNLPFDEKIIRFHEKKVKERQKHDKRKIFEIMLDDIYCMSKSL